MNLVDLAPVLAVTALFAMPVPAVAQAPRQDGLWEIKAQMEMGEPLTTTQCVSREDARSPQNLLPTGTNSSGCKVSDYKVEGNRTTFSLTCEGPPQFSGIGEIVYGQDSYTGSMKMDVGGQTVTMTYSAKRKGDCTK